MLAHKRACSWIDPELKRKVDAEIMAKADNPAGDSFVQPSHIAAFNYQSQLPPGYKMSNHSSPSMTLPPPKRMKHSPFFETIPDLTFRAPTDPVQRQEEFNSDILRLICSCELSFYLLERPEFRHFILKWIPHIRLPDCKTASGTLLRNEADRVVAQTRARTSLISAMIVVVDDEAVPVRTHDMTGRPKTGDELFLLVKADFAFMKETYGVEIIAAVMDDGPDGKKMRHLVKEDPDLRMAVFECWAHQAGLLTGNYLGVKQDFMEAASHGNDIIKWFNNHGKALDLLRNQQILILLKEYALLYPASTRWTSQFTCLSRLSSQEAIILGCVAQHRDELLLTAGPKADAKAKATEIIDRCLEPGFWQDLKRIVRHLEPLAIAVNIFQDPSCRLDHVLLTLGNIYDFFDCLDESQDGNKERGDFSRESMWLDGYAEMYQKENGEESVDVLQVWQGMRVKPRTTGTVPSSTSPYEFSPSRKKRRFDSEVGPGTGSGAGNVGSGGGSLEAAAAAMLAEQGDLDGDRPVAPSFSSVAEGLIKVAQEVPETLDDDDDDIPERLSDLIPSQARARVAQQQPAQLAPTPNHTPSTTPTSTYKRVKLADLFIYERAQDEGCNGLKFYWHIGEAIAETEKCMLEMLRTQRS
ncbi:hypothetical protein DFP72DRAFT_1060133 [Ephemerocybe angulata]|uniref:DUF659 domain-containing protein n=1 Tax=Ephemerocybe angulata TaxID=980116 RepID=A0A8H6MFZ4_9AGAR|nr:hypothetical protein DFP72DRAFT_1060133 [Tulosesus angulatus]